MMTTFCIECGHRGRVGFHEGNSVCEVCWRKKYAPKHLKKKETPKAKETVNPNISELKEGTVVKTKINLKHVQEELNKTAKKFPKASKTPHNPTVKKDEDYIPV